MSAPGRVVVIAGASGNLGGVLAGVLAREGANIAAIGRSPAQASALVESLERPLSHLALGGLDLSEPSACGEAIEQTLRRFGRLDGLVHTVGGFASAPVERNSVDLFERMFRLNVLTCVNIFAAALPPMRERRRGSLVAVGAGAGSRAGAGLAAYGAAKAGLARLVESVAEEAKANGVRANLVAPGALDTPQNRASISAAEHGSLVRMEDVANAIAFLLSDRAAGVSGVCLPVGFRS